MSFICIIFNIIYTAREVIIAQNIYIYIYIYIVGLCDMTIYIRWMKKDIYLNIVIWHSPNINN